MRLRRQRGERLMAKKAKKTTPRKRASVSKTPARGQKTSKKKAPNKRARTIKTDSYLPTPGLFTKDAETVAKTMATKKVTLAASDPASAWSRCTSIERERIWRPLKNANWRKRSDCCSVVRKQSPSRRAR